MTFVQIPLSALVPYTQKGPFLMLGRLGLQEAAGSAPETFPVEIFLGCPTLASSHSVPLQRTWKLGTSCLPKHTVTCCKYMLFVLRNLARSCYSSLEEPTSSHFSQHPGFAWAWAASQPTLASLSLCKEKMLTLVCSLREGWGGPSWLLPGGRRRKGGRGSWAASLPLEAKASLSRPGTAWPQHRKIPFLSSCSLCNIAAGPAAPKANVSLRGWVYSHPCGQGTVGNRSPWAHLGTFLS